MGDVISMMTRQQSKAGDKIAMIAQKLSHEMNTVLDEHDRVESEIEQVLLQSTKIRLDALRSFRMEIAPILRDYDKSTAMWDMIEWEAKYDGPNQVYAINFLIKHQAKIFDDLKKILDNCDDVIGQFSENQHYLQETTLRVFRRYISDLQASFIKILAE